MYTSRLAQQIYAKIRPLDKHPFLCGLRARGPEGETVLCLERLVYVDFALGLLGDLAGRVSTIQRYEILGSGPDGAPVGVFDSCTEFSRGGFRKNWALVAPVDK